MAQPLVSGSWYRVAPLKPILPAGLRIVRQQVRDQVWHVLVEPGSGRQLRLNPAAYAFVGRCDGQQTVGALWQALLASAGDDAPGQDDILRLLAQLFRAGMLQFDAAPNLSLLFSRRDEEEDRQRHAFINPLMLRMRLFDPTRLLDALEPLGRMLAQGPVLVAWLLLLLAAGLVAAVNLAGMRGDAVRVLATPSSYAIAWLAYPLIKSLHELGHALAVRRFGGAVHEIGLSLVFLTPAPYVDASAANAFPDPRHRAVVSAAGIAVELTLAALATIAWTLFAPGLLRDAAMVVILIGAVSTVLFNANPLLRLDGYHLLCDLLQLPNLAARSQAWWASFWRRVIGAERDLPAGVLAAGESKWLVLHAPAALLYRVGLLLALVGWIGHQSWLLGWLAALGVFAWVAHASLRALLRPASGMAEPLARRRALQATGGLITAALVLLFLVPAPASVVARGVVWPPDHAQLRPGAAGFVDPQLVPDGSQVANGQVVLTLSDPALEAQREKAASERSGLMAEQYQALLQDPARASDLNEQVARNAAELERAEEQLANLQLRAGTPGRAVWTREQDLPGTYAKRGAMLGYVLGPEPAQVRLVLRDEDLLRVRGRVQAIEVRLADTPWTPHRGTLRNETPAATRQLPNAALGDKQGGTVPVDPGDKDGLRTTAPVFLFDVQVPDLRADRIGGRAWVKLVLPAEPVGLQLLRQARQLLVKQFSPTGQV